MRRGIGEGNQIFYLFILPERNGEAKMVCDMARNENGGLLRMEGSGRIGSGGQRCEIQGVRDEARSRSGVGEMMGSVLWSGQEGSPGGDPVFSAEHCRRCGLLLGDQSNGISRH